MLTISAKESVLIGFITILCAVLIQSIVYTYGDEDIFDNNLFYKHKKSMLFYGTIFCIGILMHIFVKYIEYDQWYCQKVCINESCKVICTLPFNGFTKLLITA